MAQSSSQQKELLLSTVETVWNLNCARAANSRPPLHYRECLEQVMHELCSLVPYPAVQAKIQLATAGLSEALLHLGNPYSAQKKSSSQVKDQEWESMKKDLAALKKAAGSAPSNNNKKPKGGKSKAETALNKKLADTCR